MTKGSGIDLAIQLVERINRRDVEGLVGLMSDDVTYVTAETEAVGGENVGASVADYLLTWPEFMVHIAEIYDAEDTVVLVVRTTGSHAGLQRQEEIRRTRLYAIHIADERITRWAVHDDSDEKRTELGAELHTMVTD